MHELHYRRHFGLKGYFPRIEAFKGVRVITEDPLHPEIIDNSINVLEFPGTRRDIRAEPAKHPDAYPNKLLDAGLNVLATQSGWMSYCQVGSGQTQPTSGDTALETWVAGTSTQQADTYGARANPPYYGWRRRTYRFGEGVAAGNLSEVGIGWASSGATLIARHRTVNTQYQQTSITVQSDEYLDVTYELRYYPPLDDVSGTITLDGVVYDTITRASSVNSSTEQGSRIGSLMGQYSNATSDWSVYDGELGTITQAPSGTSAACDNANQANETYVNNSMQIVMYSNTGVSGWNLTGGFRSARIKSTAGNFQTRFGSQATDAKVPKDSSFTMQLKWTLSWAELIGIFCVTEPFNITGEDATLTHNVP